MGTNRSDVFALLQKELEAAGAGRLLLSRAGGDELTSIVEGITLSMTDLIDGLEPVLADLKMDEKEGYVRLHVARCDGFDIRVHIWLPVREEEYVENVHDHRRYMVSRVMCGEYNSYEFRLIPGTKPAAVELDRVDHVEAVDSRLIGPMTIHAIGNPYDRHCVSLIVRGPEVHNVLHTYNREDGTVREYDKQKPVAWTGRTAADRELSDTDYKAALIERLRAETAQR
jgi:hypothetical protein